MNLKILACAVGVAAVALSPWAARHNSLDNCKPGIYADVMRVEYAHKLNEVTDLVYCIGDGDIWGFFADSNIYSSGDTVKVTMFDTLNDSNRFNDPIMHAEKIN